MKFNVKYDPFKNAKAFRKKFDKFLESDAWKDEAAKLAITKIKGETRMQKYIATGEPQPELSEDWIKRKKELAKTNKKGTSYGPNKSNLTLTGQLLDSLQRVQSRYSVIIRALGDREPYRNKDGTSSKKTPTNSQVAKWLAEKGRFFIGYNEKLKKQITKKIKEHIRRSLL